MSTVFFAPTLHPVTQSPQPVQAFWSTPPALVSPVNVTLSSARMSVPRLIAFVATAAAASALVLRGAIGTGLGLSTACAAS